MTSSRGVLRRLALAGAIAWLALPGPAAGTTYPLVLENCGERITVERPPQRIVTIGQAATEILYALGLGERVAATSLWFTDVPERHAATDARIERLADNTPGFESVVMRRPDLVAVQFVGHVGPEGVVATRDQFHELGIATYTLPADCVAKDNTRGGDGTRTAMFETATIHRGIEELALIHGVPERGRALVEELRAREERAVQRAAGAAREGVSAVFWFSSAQLAADPYVAGRKGAPGYVMEKLGIRNVIDSDEEWPTIGWETIARADPTLIVVARMARRLYPVDDHERKLEFLRSDPVTREMEAVRKGRIVVMDAHAMDATIRTIDAIEAMADALDTFGLAR